MEAPNTTQAVQRFLDELAASHAPPDDALVRALLARSVNRLRFLSGRLLHRSYPRLTRGPAYLEADDVVGAIVERLIKAMRDIQPGSVRQFFALVNQHIRWELNDLARKIDQQHAVPLQWDPVAPRARSTSGETETFARILDAIGTLPAEEREVLEYVRIQGMTHAEAAELLDVAEKTVQRRLRRAVLLLSEALRDLAPAADPGSSDEIAAGEVDQRA